MFRKLQHFISEYYKLFIKDDEGDDYEDDD
jgi:hypothetical protein